MVHRRHTPSVTPCNTYPADPGDAECEHVLVQPVADSDKLPIAPEGRHETTVFTKLPR
jgi:hypothetical protein